MLEIVMDIVLHLFDMIIDSRDPVKAARPAVVNATPRGAHVGPEGVSQAEHLKRLEAELSERTAEAAVARSDAERAGRGVEALTILIHHLVHTYDAYSTPRLKAEVVRLTSDITEARLGLDETVAALRRLEDESNGLRENYEKKLKELEEQHNQKVAQISQQRKEELELVQEKHRQQLTQYAEEQQQQREEASRAHCAELERLEAELRAQIDLQHEQHLQAVAQLNTCHTQKVRELESSRRVREQELLETNQLLLEEQDKLKLQTKRLEESLLSDNDFRLQAAKKVCASMQNEVDSLKTVIEMRNGEIHKLRSQVTDMERMSEELEIQRERVKTLQAKTEDLQAQMEKKAKDERTLVNKHRELVEDLHKEMSMSKRLSLENEQLQWKLRQREEVMSASLPVSTLDLMTRTTPGISPRQEGVQCTPQNQPRSPRLSTRSQLNKTSSKCEPGKRWSHLSSSSEEPHMHAHSKVGNKNEDSHIYFQGDLTIESPPPSPCVKAVVEKSNSVSFILDLNEPLSDDSFRELPPSPRPRLARTPTQPRTPTLSRRVVNRARSSSLEKNATLNTDARGKEVKRVSSKLNNKTTAELKGAELSHNLSHVYHTEREKQDVIGVNLEMHNGSSCSISEVVRRDGNLNGLATTLEYLRNGVHCSGSVKTRSYSTSESSEGGEMERISPTGLAWTVPVHASNGSPSKRSHLRQADRGRFEVPPHLQQHEEDEYEENEEGDFMEIVTLEGSNGQGLSSLLAHCTNSSASPSDCDSELSQCGSRAGLTTESEESEDEERAMVGGGVHVPIPQTTSKGMPSSKSSRGCPKDGAGEAMIPEELVAQYTAEAMEEHAKTERANGQDCLASAPSSDSDETPQETHDTGLVSWSEDVECDLTSSSEMHEL